MKRRSIFVFSGPFAEAGDILFSPDLQRRQNWKKLFADQAERILNLRRDLVIRCADDQAVMLHPAELAGERCLRHVRQSALQFPEAHGAGAQIIEDQQRPFAGKDLLCRRVGANSEQVSFQGISSVISKKIDTAKKDCT